MAIQTTSIASSDDVTLALHHFGGTGPALLITHGTGLHARTYTTIAAMLRDHFTVYGLDFRGHGASTKPSNGDFGWNRIADDFEAAIDSIGAPVFVAGHSLGAATTLVVSERRPDAIERAWLYEPVIFPQALLDARPENPMSGFTRRRRADFESRAAVIERFGSRPPFDTVDPRCLADYVQHGFVDTADGVTLACEPEHEARVYEGEESVTLERVAGNPLTAVVAMGESDPRSPVGALSPPLVEQLPNATLERWPALSHFGPLEDPAAISRAIITALEPA